MTRSLAFALFLCACNHAPAADEEPRERPAQQPPGTAQSEPQARIEPRADDRDFVIGSGVKAEVGASSTEHDAPSPERDNYLAKRAALRDAHEFGMIGLLNSGVSNAQVKRLAGLDTARGNMWGDEIGESFGAGGLGLSGIGEGGGGTGEGIGLGSLGGIGHGAGTRARDRGRAATPGAGGRTSDGDAEPKGEPDKAVKPPEARVRIGKMSVVGSLEPNAIKRALTMHLGGLKRCYHEGLESDPGLKGKVTIEFTITESGAVSAAVNVPKDEQNRDGTTLPSSSVIDCLVRRLGVISFPTPEKGTVKVRCQIRLSPARKDD